MGWSCRADAMNTLNKIDAACREQSARIMNKPLGMSNVYTANGVQYIIELSRTEHDDGAITGSIMKVCDGSAYADSCRCLRAGSFKIEGDGTFSRGPAWMKALAK